MSGTAQFGQKPDPIQPRFHMAAVDDPLASASAGRPISKMQERVQFLMPGSPNQPVFVVTDEHRQRWPVQYDAFKRGNEMAVVGTPLEMWPVLNAAQVLELKAHNIFSVEQCRDMSDHARQGLGPLGARIKKLAEAYLEEAAYMSVLTAKDAELEKLHSELGAVQNQLRSQAELIERLSNQMLHQQQAPIASDTFMATPIPAMPATPPVVSALAALPEPVKRGPGRPPKQAE